MFDEGGNGKKLDFVTALRSKNVPVVSSNDRYPKILPDDPNYDKVYNPHKVLKKWEGRFINLVKEVIDSGDVSFVSVKQMLENLHSHPVFGEPGSKYNLNQSRYYPRFAKSADECIDCINGLQCSRHKT